MLKHTLTSSELIRLLETNRPIMGGIYSVECPTMTVEAVLSILRKADGDCGSSIHPDHGCTVIVCCKRAATLTLFHAGEVLVEGFLFRPPKGGSHRDPNKLIGEVLGALKEGGFDGASLRP